MNQGSYRWYYAPAGMEPCVSCGKPIRGTDKITGVDLDYFDKVVMWSRSEGEHLECYVKRTGDQPVSGHKKTASAK